MRLISIFFLLFVCASNAQPIEVYFTKGEVSILNNKSSKSAEKGYQLQKDDVLELTKDDMIVLYQEQKAVVLRGPGSYPISKISAQFSETKKSITDRYIGYLWKQAHEEDTGNEDEGKGKLGVKGMVSRGMNGITSPNDSVTVLRDKFSIHFENEIVPGYLFIYTSKKPLLYLEVDSAEYELIFGGELEKGEWYGLAASATDNPPFNSIQYFKWATETELVEIQVEFGKFLATIEEYPAEMKEELIAAYLALNNYLYVK